jgi:hypothetical protein
MPAQPEPSWQPVAWLYGGGLTLVFVLRWLFRDLLQTPEGRLKFGAWLLTTLIYGAVIFALVIAPDVPEDVARHWGQSPGGLPVRFLIWLVVTVLYIPFGLGARHFLHLFMVSGGPGGISGLILIFTRTHGKPELRRTRLIALSLVIYGIVLLIALGCLGAALHDH